MKIQILARLGMLESELRTVQSLGQALPEHWKAYCGIELILPRQKMREIDMLIVADDRIIVTEIKEWNGDSITSDGKSWFTSRHNSVSGPKTHGVNQVTGTWKMLMNRIREKTNGQHLYIDKCVVQAGTASISSLPEEEQENVLCLEDMKRIGSKEVFRRFFKNQPGLVRSRITREQTIQDLDRLLTNPNFAQGKKIRVGGFTADELPILSGPGYGFWEYRGSKDEGSSNVIALMRRWRFSSECLSSSIVTEQERNKILYNESRIQRIQRNDFSEFTFNTLHEAYTSEEACDDAFEVFEIPKKYARVSSLTSSQVVLGIDDILTLLKNIYSEINKFHSAGFVIGDLTSNSFWYSPKFGIKISNLYHSYLDKDNIVDEVIMPSDATCISSSHNKLFKESRDGLKLFSIRTDLSLAAEIAKQIILKSDQLGAEEPNSPSVHRMIVEDLYNWISLHEDSNGEVARFQSIDYALQSLIEISKKTGSKGISAIEQFIANENIWTKFQIRTTEQLPGGCTRIYTADNKLVDTWTNIFSEKGNDSNLKLAGFLHNINSLLNIDIPAIHLPIEIGFCKSTNTVYLVYEMEVAQEEACPETRGFELIANVDDAKSFVADLLGTIIKLHQLNISLGSLEYEMIYAFKDGTHIKCKIVAPFRYSNTSREEYQHLYENNNEEPISEKRADLLLCMDIAKQVISSHQNANDLVEKANEIIEDPRSDISALRKYIKDLAGHGSELLELKGTISIPAMNRIDQARIYSDEGKIYCETSANGEKIYLSGSADIATVRLDEQGKQAMVIAVKKLSHLDYLRKKKRCNIIEYGDIILTTQDDSRAGQQAYELLEQHNKIDIRESGKANRSLNGKDQKEQVNFRNEAARNLWEALMAAEEKLLPRFKVLNEIRLTYGSTQEFEVQDLSSEDGDESALSTSGINEVEVLSRGEWVSIGQLLSITKQMFLIKPRHRNGWTIKAGQEIRIDNVLSRSSRQKRQAALDDVLEGKSVIGGIHEYFLGSSSNPMGEDNLISTGNFVNSAPESLNESQRKAFIGILQNRGPISIVQGPPGTGKTFFIATLIGKILRDNPTSRILISGQSHESVNNCIEKTLAINPMLASALKVIRLGDEAQLPKILLEYSEEEIQDYYLNTFESEFNYRVSQAVNRLPVPTDAIKDIVEVSRLLHEIQKLRLSLSRAKEKQVKEGEIARRIEKMIRTTQIIIGKAGDDQFTSNLEEIANTDKNGAKNILASVIADKYQLHDIRAIHKVFNIVSISYEWCQSLRVSRRAFQEHLTSTRNLVCGTCVGVARSHYEMDESVFDWVIVDEAGRASFTELCIPMRYGKKIVLIGDEKQLPPQIDNEIVKYIESEQKVYSRDEIKKSDFERIIRTGYGRENTYQLLEQYRMSGSIGDLCSTVFYDKLLANKANALEASNIIEYQGHSLSGLAWIDTSCLGEESYEEKGEATSFINRTEANIIVEIVVSLLQYEGHRHATIGAICMYKDQVRLIEENINKVPVCREALKGGQLEIGTVDSFQGRERDIVFLSLVRSNRENNAGFLKVSNRINVAISRARQHLLIIGNSRIATSQASDSAIAKVYNYIKANSSQDDCNLINEISMDARNEEIWL
jgi:hypothetical protein